MAARRDKTHYLYIAVIAAVLLGIAVGCAAPGVAVELKPWAPASSTSSR